MVVACATEIEFVFVYAALDPDISPNSTLSSVYL